MTYNYEEMSVLEVRDLLRSWRENNERKSDEIIELWEALSLEDKLSKLGNEKHVILEQVIFAALDCHHYEIAELCIGILSSEFPGSLRVLRYQAMKLEAMERYDEALELIETLIKRDETNAAPRKRKVAIMKARGKITEAIKELTEYLKRFMSDMEAWQELCELYLSQGEYSKAAFCAEELLLHQPHSHLLHQRVADIRYTMGGTENLEMAKTYYLQALKLNPNNMRATFGLFSVTNYLSGYYKSNASKKKDMVKLNQWATELILSKYKDASANKPYLVNPTKSIKAKKTNTDQLENMFTALSVGN